MSEQFSEEVLRIAMAQICSISDFGNFDSAEGRAFDTLVDVVGKYIEKIGLLCRRYAEHDGRTESNLLDLLQAFDKLEPNRVDWRDLERMCREVPWQVPYTSGVPEFPIERRKRRMQYGSSEQQQQLQQQQTNSTARKDTKDESKLDHPNYVPSHFPNFPERYTYSSTEIDAAHRETNPQKILKLDLEEKRRVQEALVKIHESSGGKPQASSSSFGQVSGENGSGEEQSTSTAPKLPDAFH